MKLEHPGMLSAVINVAVANSTIVAAVATKKIRVLSCVLVATAAVTARFESTSGGAALTGVMPLAIDGQLILPYNPHGWFETVAGELLNLELGASLAVDGVLNYDLIS